MPILVEVTAMELVTLSYAVVRAIVAEEARLAKGERGCVGVALLTQVHDRLAQAVRQ